MSARPRLLLAFAAAAVLALWPQAATAAEPECADHGGVGYVCGIANPEDLLRVDGTPFVLTGNMGDPETDEGGGFFEVDVRTRRARVVRPAFPGRAQDAYRGCPGPPEPHRFTVHGIDIRSEAAGSGAPPARTVYAVNHGGRESIEVFRLDAGEAGLRLTWIGCALLPESYAANSVAALPGGGFVTTVPVRSEQELPAAGLGRPTGAVLRWSPAAGWREVPGVELSFPNGILVSPDARWLYVAAYTEQAVARVSLDREPVQTGKVEVPFNPDNLRWDPAGHVLATGQEIEPALMELTCVRSSAQTCEVPTGVSRVDPATLQATTLFRHPGDERFGAGTSAIVVGDELWVGSVRAQRLLRVPRSALAGPVGREPDAGPPRLRLTRRCSRGGLRVALTGDVHRVRDVSFKLGRRLVARDEQAPLRRTIPRRVLRTTRRRQVRAVAYLADGRPFRVVLARSLPRCGG